MFYEFHHFGKADYFSKSEGVDLNFPKHLHRAYEFVSVLSGEMDIYVDGKKHLLTTGESALVFPHQLHFFESRECRYELLLFSPETVNSFSKKNSSRLPTDSKVVLSRYVFDLLRSLREEDSVVKKKAALYSLAAEFDEGREYRSRDETSSALIYRLFEFVESNYRSCCSLKALAQSTGYAYAYLSRHFKETVGVSFNSYVNSCRINYACYLLSTTEKTVTECSGECGYSSLRSFNRNFCSVCGVTPSEYRALRYSSCKE